MNRRKIAAYEAASKLSHLSKLPSSMEKRAFDIDELHDMSPFIMGETISSASGIPLIGPISAGVMAPEGRGMSRFLHSLGYGTLGAAAGSGLGLKLGLSPKLVKALGGASGLAGGAYGIHSSIEGDSLLDRIEMNLRQAAGTL
jgi:hypothetical protein